MIIIAAMSGHTGYREIGVFLKAHRDRLCSWLGLKKRVPSYVTIRDILRRVDNDELRAAFAAWASERITTGAKDQIAIDGKALGSTVIKHDSEAQDFVCIVSAFSQRHGAVLAIERYHNGHMSELAAVESLIEQLECTGVTLTLDALHCKKSSSNASSAVGTTI